MNAVTSEAEVQKRKNYLVSEMNKLGVDRTRDGRKVNALSLYSLEWVHIEEKNKMARAMG